MNINVCAYLSSEIRNLMTELNMINGIIIFNAKARKKIKEISNICIETDIYKSQCEVNAERFKNYTADEVFKRTMDITAELDGITSCHFWAMNFPIINEKLEKENG